MTFIQNYFSRGLISTTDVDVSFYHKKWFLTKLHKMFRNEVISLILQNIG